MNNNYCYVESKKHFFGKDFPEVIMEMSCEWIENPEKHIFYKKGLCFRCNNTIPQKTYCHPMYGGKYMQSYGWYVNQEYYNLGIDREDNSLVAYNSFVKKIHILPDECTPELYDTVQRINELISKREKVSKMDMTDKDEISMLHSSIDRAIENSVRERFGFRKIGEAWVSETMLFNIISILYPNEEIIRHYRPQWLEGLELDIYLPNLKTGIEYQGIQHFQAVEHWGGQKQLKKQQEHDARKKRLCKELGVQLVCINYYEPLSAEHIRIRMAETT